LTYSAQQTVFTFAILASLYVIDHESRAEIIPTRTVPFTSDHPYSLPAQVLWWLGGERLEWLVLATLKAHLLRVVINDVVLHYCLPYRDLPARPAQSRVG